MSSRERNQGDEIVKDLPGELAGLAQLTMIGDLVAFVAQGVNRLRVGSKPPGMFFADVEAWIGERVSGRARAMR
jgi:hypothetical protein